LWNEKYSDVHRTNEQEFYHPKAIMADAGTLEFRTNGDQGYQVKNEKREGHFENCAGSLTRALSLYILCLSYSKRIRDACCNWRQNRSCKRPLRRNYLIVVFCALEPRPLV